MRGLGVAPAVLLSLGAGGCSPALEFELPPPPEPRCSSCAETIPVVGPEVPEAPRLGAGGAEVSPPALLPCPDGWSPVEEEGFTRCGPAAPNGPACPFGQIRLPGEVECRPVGRSCPDGGRWPEPLPDGARRLFVAADGGDDSGPGTRDRPWATLRRAVASATAEDVVIVSAGTFVESIELTGGVRVVGACAAETRLRSPAGSDEVVVITGSARLEDVSLLPERTGVEVTGTTARAELRGLALRGGRGRGVFVSGGGHAEIVGLDVDDFEQTSLFSGAGVEITRNSTARIEAASIRRTQGEGVRIRVGSGVQLSKTVIADVREAEDTDSRSTTAILVELGSTATISETWILRSRMTGVLARDGSRAQVRDALVSDLLPVVQQGSIDAVGLLAISDSELDVSRTAVVDGIGQALSAVFDSRIRASDVVVIRTAPELQSTLTGLALYAGEGSRVDVERFAAVRSARGAIQVTQASELTATDLMVLRTLDLPIEGREASAIRVRLGSKVQLSRARLEENRAIAVLAQDEGTTVTGEDVDIIATLNSSRSTGIGIGVVASLGASVALSRCRLVESQVFGVVVEQGADSRVELTDCEVDGVLPFLLSNGDAQGAYVTAGELVAERVRFRGMSGRGLEALGPDARLVLRDVEVEDVRANVNGRSAGAVIVAFEAEGRFERVRVERAAGVGLLVESEARLDAQDLVIDDVTVTELRERDAAGLVVAFDAIASMERGAIRDVEGIGLFVGTGAAAAFADLEIAGESSAASMRDAIQVVSPASFFGRRLRLFDVVRAGLVVSGRQAHAEVEGLVVEDRRTSEIRDEVMTGLVIENGGQLDLSRARFRGIEETGVWVTGPRSRLDAASVVVSRSTSSRGAPLEARAALLASGDTDVDVDGFRFSGSGRAAFRIESGARLNARDGTVEGHEVVLSRDAETATAAISDLTTTSVIDAIEAGAAPPPEIELYEPSGTGL